MEQAREKFAKKSKIEKWQNFELWVFDIFSPKHKDGKHKFGFKEELWGAVKGLFGSLLEG